MIFCVACFLIRNEQMSTKNENVSFHFAYVLHINYILISTKYIPKKTIMGHEKYWAGLNFLACVYNFEYV